MSEPIQSISQGNYILQGTVATSAGIVGDGSTQNPIRIDETVLWSGNGNTATAFNMSESPFNFAQLKFIPSVNNDSVVAQDVIVTLNNSATAVAIELQMPRSDIWSTVHELYTISNTGMTLQNCNYTWGAWGSTTATTNTATLNTRIGKVIGINRIANN